jgi:hypothetical protein
VVSGDAREGQTLNANYATPILRRIADLSTLTLWAQVSEADVTRLKEGSCTSPRSAAATPMGSYRAADPSGAGHCRRAKGVVFTPMAALVAHGRGVRPLYRYRSRGRGQPDRVRQVRIGIHDRFAAQITAYPVSHWNPSRHRPKHQPVASRSPGAGLVECRGCYGIDSTSLPLSHRLARTRSSGPMSWP